MQSNAAAIQHFQDVTSVASATDYINSMGSESLLIYSPTSLQHLRVSNAKMHMIDSRILARSMISIRALAQSRRKYSNIASLGGGTATDVAKYIAHQRGATFTCIPSMLSTNAYATNKVALVVDNEKITLDAKLADRIILDEALLLSSPQQNLYGLADVLSIHTALKDWQLASELKSEVINNDTFDQARNLLDEVKAFILGSDVNEISHEVQKLFKFIGESGYVTNAYGSGRPESGSEHIFARSLEHRIDIPHGISVSLGILLMSILQGNFTKDIGECVKKLGTLKFIDEHGLTRELIESVLTDLHPREDRFSIIDREPIDAVRAREIVDVFTSETNPTFFKTNSHALRK